VIAAFDFSRLDEVWKQLIQRHNPRIERDLLQVPVSSCSAKSRYNL